MKLITLDLETFWSVDHTLKKMNPFDYVMHPETELISMALTVDDDDPVCVFGEPAIRDLVKRVNWADSFAIAHNMSGFDALIMAWRLGIKPKLWGCTLAMARPIHAKVRSLSLASLVEHYGIGKKDNTALIQTRGKHLKDFTVDERRQMAVYNCEDTTQCRELFKRLRPHYSAAELWHLDTRIRMLVDPAFVVDVPVLEQGLADEKKRKRDAMLRLADLFPSQILAGTEGGPVSEDYVIDRTKTVLSSAASFGKVLEARGVPVPMKPSPTSPEKFIPALAKTDAEFQALLDHDDEIVVAAVEARLAAKSTIGETRMQAFIDVAGYAGGRWPVPVNYCGADTTGRSSGWHYNPLNMPKIKKTPKPTDALRMSLTVPAGHVVVVADSSGIEMRFNHFLWRVPYSTALWRSKPDADVYRHYAGLKFNVPTEQVTDEQRHAGKVDNLALGFQMGAAKYVHTARTQGGLILTLEDAEIAVATWRGQHPEIAGYKTGGWALCGQALEWIANGVERPIDPGGMFWTCEEGIRLPSGRLIRYPALRREDGDWYYGEGRHRAKIYQGKVTENVVQAGARDIVYDAALRVFGDTRIRPALEVYDELAYVVPEKEAEPLLACVHSHMRAKVKWFPELVTWSEGGIAERYGLCK